MSVCFIVPPHVYEHVNEHGNAKQKDWARQALQQTARIRGRRDVLSQLSFATLPVGTLRRTIYDAQRGLNLPGVLVRSEEGPAVQDRDVNQAYDGSGTTYDFYKAAFGRTSIDDRGMRLDSSVHYDQNLENAMWDGREMLYGDGGEVFQNFTGCLDVIAHELTHGVTGFESGLVYSGEPGALNESMSDVFGSLTKQWSKKQKADQADWLIGDGIFIDGSHGNALRSMKAPGTAYKNHPLIGSDPQPDNMKSKYKGTADHGGVHINSGIPNRAFYLTAQSIGGFAWEKAGLIWYRALPQLPSNCSFQLASDTTLTSAISLFGVGSTETKAVVDAWATVGIKAKALSKGAGA